MAILKLSVGRNNAISGTVESVALAEGKFGPQYRFTLAGGDDLYLPKDGVERQASRAGHAPEEYAGKVVTIWKKPMEGDATGTKGYLNIDLGGSGQRTATRHPLEDDVQTRDLRQLGVLPAKKDYEQVKADYVATLGDAIAILNDAKETLEIPFGPSDYLSLAATLFIERNKRGV